MSRFFSGGLTLGGPTQGGGGLMLGYKKKTSGGLTLGGPTQTKKTMGGGLDDYLKRARCARLMLEACGLKLAASFKGQVPR